MNNAEKNLKTTPGSDCALNALAVDEPLEYARLYLDGNLQMWVDAEGPTIQTMQHISSHDPRIIDVEADKIETIYDDDKIIRFPNKKS